MGATEKRMEQLGIQLQQTDWRGKGAVEAVFAGDILYLSAHFPVDEMGRPVYVGRVGAQIDEETAYKAARLCGLNMHIHLFRLVVIFIHDFRITPPCIFYDRACLFRAIFFFHCRYRSGQVSFV